MRRAVPSFYIRCVGSFLGQRRQSNSEEWRSLAANIFALLEWNPSDTNGDKTLGLCSSSRRLNGFLRQISRLCLLGLDYYYQWRWVKLTSGSRIFLLAAAVCCWNANLFPCCARTQLSPTHEYVLAEGFLHKASPLSASFSLCLTVIANNDTSVSWFQASVAKSCLASVSYVRVLSQMYYVDISRKANVANV